MVERSERYALGFPEMDEQHRYLFEIFDLLEDTPRVTDSASAKILIEEIERYVLFHFASEEQLIRRYNAPGFAAHQSNHEALEARLAVYIDDLESGNLNPGRMRAFLSSWLDGHSRDCDSVYVQWITARREQLRASRLP